MNGFMRPLLFLALASSLIAADWPAYRADASRSGYTSETIPNQLRQRWAFRLPSGPRIAWPNSERMEYDRAFQPIIVGDLVLFGSSADDQVYALDAKSGRVAWRFFTGGPVRFAPAAWKDRVFVVSDDGHLYALALADGKVLWKHRAGPAGRQVLGNERMISHWPARGGPVVMDDIVYYAGGIWPSDGVYLHALNADTGAPVWQNGDTGSIYMPQPHGGAEAASGVAPQGYLLASGGSLIVPTGRAVPAVFERADGKLRYYHLQKNQQRGGTRVLVTESNFLNAGTLFDIATGEASGNFGSGPSVAINGGVVRAEGRSLATYRWKDVEKIDRKGQSYKVRVLEQDKVAPVEREVLELIITGPEAVVGADGMISAIDYTGQRTEWWKHKVEGRVLGLAAGNGRLVATTDAGIVYLFDGDPAPLPIAEAPAEEKPLDAAIAAEAKAILDATKVTEGYAVVLGAAHADFALALARQSSLHIIAIEADEASADAARHRIAAAGLYGTRVSVHSGSLEATTYPKHFANLVIAPKDITPAIQKELERLRRPYGGIICHRGSLKLEKAATLAILRRLEGPLVANAMPTGRPTAHVMIVGHNPGLQQLARRRAIAVAGPHHVEAEDATGRSSGGLVRFTHERSSASHPSCEPFRRHANCSKWSATRECCSSGGAAWSQNDRPWLRWVQGTPGRGPGLRDHHRDGSDGGKCRRWERGGEAVSRGV